MEDIKCLDKGFVRYIGHYGSDADIPRIARVSTGSENKGDEQDKKLLEYLYRNAHSSPFEFCSITYLMKLPLFVRDQFVRHRTAKVNIMSLRYQEAKDEFYVPTQWRIQDTKNRQGSHPVEDGIWLPNEQMTATDVVAARSSYAHATYSQMVEAGIAKEMARMVLGTNLYTYMYFQIDLNNLTKFLNLRVHPHAQHEAQVYALAMEKIFEEKFPWVCGIYRKFKMKMVEV